MIPTGGRASLILIFVVGLAATLLVSWPSSDGWEASMAPGPDPLRVVGSAEPALGQRPEPGRLQSTTTRQHDRGSVRTLHVGCDPIALRIVADLGEEQFESRHPDIVASVAVGPHETMLRRLQRGMLDIVLTSHSITYRDRRKGLQQEALGRLAMVPIVHPSSRLVSLSRMELRNILAGKTSDWSRLGGKGPLALVEAGELEHRAGVLRLLPGLRFPADRCVTASVAAAVRRVATTPGSFALVPHHASLLGVKTLAIDGVSSTPFSVYTGTYPLTYTVRLVAKQAAPPRVVRFRRFLRATKPRILLTTGLQLPR